MSYSNFKRNAGLIALTIPLRAAPCVAVAMLLAACDSSVSQLDTDSLSLAIPERIRDTRAIDPSAVTALATVNGVEVVLTPSADGTFSGDVSVPANSVVPVSIQFTEQVNGQALVLATQTQQVTTGNTDNRVTLRRSAYNFDAHDADGDSVSNIIEREENTDPRDANDAPPMVNVNVVASQPADAGNNSSGSYTVEATVGNSVRTLERSGNQFRGAFYTVNRAPVTVSADFIEDVTGQRLSVASQSYELSSIFDQQTITFSESGYQLTNRDNDGQSDLAEVVAGTSIFEGNGNDTSGSGNADGGNTDTGNTDTDPGNTGGDTPGDVSFTTTFDIPAAIQNAGVVYADYRIDGQSAGLNRDGNSYTASYSIAAGAIAVLDITLLDNFNGSPYVVAQAQKTLPITSDQQLVEFFESDFTLQFDTDNDGALNYIEREQGTDPLTANDDLDNTDDPDPDPDADPDPDPDPDPDNSDNTVTCAVNDVPAQVITAGGTATQSLIGFVDCGGADFELDASEYEFSWNSGDNSIQWVIPAVAVPGSQLSYTVDVRNPAIADEVYASFQVNTTVAPPDNACNATTSTSEFTVSRDVHVQGIDVFNDVQLRVDGNERVTLLAFAVPADSGVTGNATLSLIVGNDEGDGTVNVTQIQNFQWAETDSELQLPQTATSLGSLTNSWLSGQEYQFNLNGLTPEDSGEITLILSQSGGNDVAFLARESGTSATLAVEFTDEDCDGQ